MELFDEANALHEAGRYAEAEELYDLLLAQNPDNPGLLATVGTLNLRLGRYGLAISLLHRAVEKTPQSDILCNLAVGYKYSGQYEKAKHYFKKATELPNPDPGAIANYAALFVNVGTPDEAIKLSKKAIAADPQCSMAHWNMAMALLELGQWDTAWEEHEWGYQSKMRIDRAIGGKPKWDGTPGKKIVVYGEQGLGDEIMFASMLPDLMKENTVILESHRRLKTIFEKSFPGLEVHGTREDKAPEWHNEPFDAQISIGSLGQFFRRSKEAFPGTSYLKADSAPRGSKFRVGISWTGGLKQGRVLTRSIPLTWWKTILNNDCEFVSLQYTDCAADISALEKNGYMLKQFPEITDKDADYYETAKLVKSCDLVISVCTSVIHLAGALGVPCWVMVPKRTAWRYGVKGPMRWYRSVRLYRQPEADQGSWIPVLQKCGYDLQQLLNSQEQERMVAND